MRRFATRVITITLAVLTCVTANACAQTPGAAAPAPATARASGATELSVAKSTIVLLVRHAEKAPVPADDPPLSDVGTARAQALGAALADAGVTAVVVTPRLRTRATAQPVASARGLTPNVVSLEGGLDAHVRAVAAAVRRHAGGVVLVVGHSNTIPAIIGALGGPKLPDLCDASYSNLFTLVLEPGDGVETAPPAARLVRAHYGAADPAGAGDCAAMAPR